MGCTSATSLLDYEDFSDNNSTDQKKQLESILLKNHGLFDLQIKVTIRDTEGLSLAYTPGVAQPCLEIQKDLSKAYEQTNKGNSILVLTDSSKFAGDKKCKKKKKTVEGKNWNNNANLKHFNLPSKLLKLIKLYYLFISMN